VLRPPGPPEEELLLAGGNSRAIRSFFILSVYFSPPVFFLKVTPLTPDARTVGAIHLEPDSALYFRLQERSPPRLRSTPIHGISSFTAFSHPLRSLIFPTYSCSDLYGSSLPSCCSLSLASPLVSVPPFSCRSLCFTAPFRRMSHL